MTKNLSFTADEIKLLKSLFKVPEAPKIGINDPEFENLTEAEKLNDSQYRRLIYQLYPNERTCGCCSPTNAERYGGWCNSSNNNGNIDNRNHKSSEIRSDFPVRCGRRASSCCSSAWTTRWRQRQEQQEQQKRQGQQRFETSSTVEEGKKIKGLNNGNDDKVLHFMSRYCVENQRSNELYNGTYCSDERIRGGGGSTREEDPGKPARGVEELKNSEWPGFPLNECPKNSTYPVRYDDIAGSNQIQTYYLSSRFKSTCPESSDERNILNSRKSTKHLNTCRRKKCPHIDCLTRAFEEAQEFVDSLGKVPGLPGLGLMDPTASPYYCAPRDFKKIKDEMQDQGMTGSPYTSTSPWSKDAPFTIPVPGRNGIVREAIGSDDNNYKYNHNRYYYGDKDKCNDELNTPDVIGPCGERQCKARRKKVHRESVVTEGVETPVEYSDEPKKKDYLMRARHKDRDRDKDRKYKFNRQKVYHAGPRGDGFRKSIKKSKKRKTRKRVNVDFVSRSHSERLYGHKNCNNRLRRVPAHMGWFWTEYQPIGRLKPRIGWRPGAISKQIREMIQAAKIGLIEKRNRPVSVPSAMRIGKKLKTKSSTMLKKKPSKKFDFNAGDFKAPPTLYIQRRDGIYYFTMYPVKKESENTPVLDEPMKPLQFKIAPNRDDASGASSSVASDMDIEFSPPAALNRAKKKPDVVHVDTQVRQQDILDAFQPLVPEVRKVKSRKKGKKKKK